MEESNENLDEKYKCFNSNIDSLKERIILILNLAENDIKYKIEVSRELIKELIREYSYKNFNKKFDDIEYKIDKIDVKFLDDYKNNNNYDHVWGWAI